MSPSDTRNTSDSWRSHDYDRASRKSTRSIKSIDSSYSNDQAHIHESHSDDVLDALGLIPDDTDSLPDTSRNHQITNNNPFSFSDHRRFSDIKPDQKMVRPIKSSNVKFHSAGNTAELKPNDVFTQQSKLLSHKNDRRGIHPSNDQDYGSTTMKNKMPQIQQQTQSPVTVTNTSFSNPNPFYRKNNLPPTRSLLSQSVPVSTFSETYTEARLRDEDNSIYASSNPSSRGSSETSSLDDVCFPVDSLDEINRSKLWPNLSILEEFAQEELEELKRIHSSSASQKSSTPMDDNNVNFQYPIISNVDYGDLTEPLIVSTNEEIDPINGRLRPKKRVPWNHNHNKHTFVTKHDKLTKFRFTYFREDLPDTIHSPTISGLLHNGKKFEDLFSPSHYGVDMHTPDDKEASSTSIKLHKIPTVPNAVSALANLSQDAASSMAATPNATTTSLSTSNNKGYVQPFWLDVLNPTEDEMKAISKTFGIHPLTSEDIFLGEAREKVELFKDYYFVCFTSFDVEEEHERRKRVLEKAYEQELEEEEQRAQNDRSFLTKIMDKFTRSSTSVHSSSNSVRSANSRKSRKSEHRRSYAAGTPSVTSKKLKKQKKYNKDELIPLTMYIVVFKDGVITFHVNPTPHTGNVRRRARLLRDYLTVTSDWIGYALIDDITDAFAPLIEAIETEVNAIEDEIITMQSGDTSDESDSDSESDDELSTEPYYIKVKRRNSNINGDLLSISTKSSISSSSTISVETKIISWKKKGDMLRRIGNCRRRVMSLLRLLGSKADVIKGFSKRSNEKWDIAPRSEIVLYLGDIQDHIVTMVQNLNHYEKLLARSHSNYLAQINIDMTKVNNDMNDILGKITILGTIVLPLNIITGLWGMNCLVPGQDVDDLSWFWGIVTGMIIFSVTCYYYVRKFMNMV